MFIVKFLDENKKHWAYYVVANAESEIAAVRIAMHLHLSDGTYFGIFGMDVISEKDFSESSAIQVREI